VALGGGGVSRKLDRRHTAKGGGESRQRKPDPARMQRGLVASALSAITSLVHHAI
jgi:hypothetical protein